LSCPITSFEGEYSINGELFETFSIDNVNISAFETLEFVAGNPALFTEVAIHEIEVVITHVNGVVNNSPENNSLLKNISIGSELVAYKPFFEMFTSATCGPCVGANENLTLVLGNNADSTYSLVKYQVNWPGNGDPYYIEDNGIRADYYNVSGVPSFFINGQKSGQTYMFNQNDFNEASNVEAFVDISLNHVFDGINVEVSATIDPNLYIEDATVHMAIVEKTTYNNTSTNGETEFHHVVMAMLPDGNGTSTSLEAGSPIEVIESTNLITTYIEEYDDLMLVVWLQDENSQWVLQSESYDLTITTGMNDQQYNEVLIYPNPTTGLFTIQGIEDCYVEILDITGRSISTEYSSVNITSINISDFDKGIYFVKIMKEHEVVYNQKIILK